MVVEEVWIHQQGCWLRQPAVHDEAMKERNDFTVCSVYILLRMIWSVRRSRFPLISSP